MKRCKYKCDDFTAYSSMEMTGYILNQCSPEDIITTWYNYVLEYMPSLYSDDNIVGHFSLSDLLFMYQNNILADEMYKWAFDRVDDWLEDEIYRASKEHMPTLDISVNINKFHIDLTWED